MRFILILILLFPSLLSLSQENKQSAFTLNYKYAIPDNFFANHFGNNSAVNFLFFIEQENNLTFGVDIEYMFSRDVKNRELIFQNISTENGAIIASDGYYANINLMQSGLNTHLLLGYAFHFEKNNLSGIYLSSGIGYIQQKIIIDTKNENIPQLNEDYKKGYDKEHNGLSSKISLDYKYYKPRGYLQFAAGINYTLAQIQYTAPYFFNEMKYTEEEKYWGGLLGFQIGVIIPIATFNQEEFHYY